MTYEFKFTPEFINVIAAGVRKLPFEIAAPVLEAIQREVNEQDAKAAAAKIKADEAAKLDSVAGRDDMGPAHASRLTNGAAEAQPQQ